MYDYRQAIESEKGVWSNPYTDPDINVYISTLKFVLK